MPRVSWRRRGLDETLTALPDYALVGLLRVPEADVGPVRAIWQRVAVALIALLVAVIIVYLGRDGYTDVRGVPLSFIDCVYFATVSLTTVGYGDLTPYTEFARLINILVITPLRILFLVVLVGTTLQVLTERSRQAWKIQRWRSRVRNHTVVVGYGTKGKSAVAAILDDEIAAARSSSSTPTRPSLDRASAAGLVTVHGDATRSDVLRLAAAQHASAIIVATSRDDDRGAGHPDRPRDRARSQDRGVDSRGGKPAPAAAIRRRLGGRLLRDRRPAARHGHHNAQRRGDDRRSADAGRGTSPSPSATLSQAEVGGSPRHLSDIVLGVVRDGQLLRVDAPEVDAIEAGDRLLYVRSSARRAS